MIKVDVPVWQADILRSINAGRAATASELISYYIETVELNEITPVLHCEGPKETVKLYLPTRHKRKLEHKAEKNKKKEPNGAGIAAIVRGIIASGIAAGRANTSATRSRG